MSTPKPLSYVAGIDGDSSKSNMELLRVLRVLRYFQAVSLLAEADELSDFNSTVDDLGHSLSGGSSFSDVVMTKALGESLTTDDLLATWQDANRIKTFAIEMDVCFILRSNTLIYQVCIAR